MTKKIFAGCLLTAILLTFSLVMVSAASLDIPASSIYIPTSVNHDGGSFQITFDLVNSGTSAAISWNTIMSENVATFTFSDNAIEDGSVTPITKTITATGTFASNQNGDFRGTITATPSGAGNPKSLVFSIPIVDAPSLSISDTSISEAGTQATITIKNNGNVNFPTVNINIPNIEGADFTYPSSISNLNAGQSKPITIDVVTSSSLNIGPNIASITATSDTTTAQGELTIEKNFCKYGEQGTDLEITDVKIDNNDGDDEEWSPLDKITIEVEVSNNNGDDKLKDIMVELGLFNSEGKNIVKDLDDLDNEEIDLGSIKSDDEDIAVFTFTIPADFESENYKLVIKAYSDDLGEDQLCVAQNSDFDNDYYQTIDGIREEDEEKHVIFDNIKISPSIAQCGERVQLTGEIFNIGDYDYEGQVKVTLFNNELSLNLEEIVRQDLDQGDSEVVEFEFDIPAGALEKLYTLEFRTYYDYDEDDDTYDIVSDDKFISTLRIEGNCMQEAQGAQITAELDSETPEVIAGKQVIINANLKNTGDAETTYTVSVSGNTAWSNLVSLDPQIFSLAAGESKEVNIVLSINEGIEGDKEFTIKASYDNQETEKKVILTITGESEQQLGSAVEHIRNNWFIYLIILINIILIIAIILVIRSMVAPRPM